MFAMYIHCQKMQKKELEKDIDAVIAGMRKELVKAATAAGYT